ncbi:MAG: RNA polymerase sigma factor [Phycisphaerales bacterium]|jgi:RNA polymerase sigma-70 factor (ECF subfamily)
MDMDAEAIKPEPAFGSSLSRDEFATRYQCARPQLTLLAFAILGDRALAEDLVQEAAVTALERLSSFDPATSLLAWMSQIVRNHSLNALKSRTRRRTFATSSDDLTVRPAAGASHSPPPAITPAGELTREQAAFDDRLTAALLELDFVQRSCLLLRTVGDLPYSKVALITGVPEGTAMSHVHRARKALRERLAPAPPPNQGPERNSTDGRRA